MQAHAIVSLAGGGILGAAYEVGALAAVEDAVGAGAIHRACDVFIGVSAGAVVAAALSQAVPARRLYDDFAGDCATALRRTVLRLGTRGSRTRRFERALREYLERHGLSNRFADLRKTLLIPAVDLDRGEVHVFGRDATDRVTISEAIAASCAIPPYFEPFAIGDRRFVDGALGAPVFVDPEVAAGVKRILIVDPIVPAPIPPSGGIGRQCKRILHASREALAMAQVRSAAPTARVVHFKPGPDEMYAASPMDWTAKDVVLRLGAELTAKQFVQEDGAAFFGSPDDQDSDDGSPPSVQRTA